MQQSWKIQCCAKIEVLQYVLPCFAHHKMTYSSEQTTATKSDKRLKKLVHYLSYFKILNMLVGALVSTSTEGEGA